MTAPAIPWLSAVLRERFSGRVSKVALDAGPGTCPNRDGTLGTSGCVWCDPGGSGPDGPERALPWESVLEAGAARALAGGEAGVVAYFQAFSATHRPASELAALAARALAVPGVVGLAVGSRPDSLLPPVLEVLEALHRRAFLWVEVGMQSCHDTTLRACNRGHRHAHTVGAVEALRQRGIRCVLHLIAGLPGEGEPEMRASFLEAARLAPWGVKLHPLHVVRGAPLEPLWLSGRVGVLDLDAYSALAADLLEVLPPGTVVHRLTGGRPDALLLAPKWCRHRRSVLNAIARERARRAARVLAAPHASAPSPVAP